MKYRELFYISNLLSALRVLLVIPIYYWFNQNTPTAVYWIVSLLLVAALTDSFDGRLARRLNQQSDLGRILDPVADKIAMGIIAYLLVKLRGLPLWFLGLVLLRDMVILLTGLLILRKKNIVVESVMIGKITVTTLAALILIYTTDFAALKQPFLWINVVLVIASSVVYFLRFKDFFGKEEVA